MSTTERTHVNSETPINSHSQRPPRETPIFDEPIPADVPRRQFDRKLLEAYDADHARIRNISNRQTGIEALLAGVQKDLRRLEEQQGRLAASMETLSIAMSEISTKFSVHAQMEEFQWDTVNKANLTLAEVGSALTEHLRMAGAIDVRMSWMEKLLYALWGVVGAGAAMLIPLAMKGLGL